MSDNQTFLFCERLASKRAALSFSAAAKNNKPKIPDAFYKKKPYSQENHHFEVGIFWKSLVTLQHMLSSSDQAWTWSWEQRASKKQQKPGKIEEIDSYVVSFCDWEKLCCCLQWLIASPWPCGCHLFVWAALEVVFVALLVWLRVFVGDVCIGIGFAVYYD